MEGKELPGIEALQDKKPAKTATIKKLKHKKIK
jgi:hypothetical protein